MFPLKNLARKELSMNAILDQGICLLDWTILQRNELMKSVVVSLKSPNWGLLEWGTGFTS